MSLETARRVLRIEAEALESVLARVDGSFERAVEILLGCKGRFGGHGHGQVTAGGAENRGDVFPPTGTPSVFLHPAEALHGDLGMVMAGDTVLVHLLRRGNRRD